MPAAARQAPAETEQLTLLEPPPDDAEPSARKPLASAFRDAARGRRYKRRFDPSQMSLLPQSYNDFIGRDSAVRAIADFRKDNIDAIKRMQREFLIACGELKLIGGRKVGIDGSFFNADASARSMRTLKQLKLRAEVPENSIAAYHAEHDAADADEDAQRDDAGEARIDTAQLDGLRARAAETRALIK